jgi:hypothetical protein
MQGSSVTLLLPLDEHGVLGAGVACVDVPSSGLTTLALLSAIHDYYAQQIEPAEQVSRWGIAFEEAHAITVTVIGK